MIDGQYIRQLQLRYKSWLKDLILGQPFMPIILRGGKEKPDNQKALQTAIESFLKYEKKNGRPGWTIEWKPWKSPRVGNQVWPASITVDTEADLLFILGKGKEVAIFRERLEHLMAWNYQIADWLLLHPLDLLKPAKEWEGICLVIDFLLSADASQYYKRSLPIAVHTKFIEDHEKTILTLLQTIDPERYPKNIQDLELAVGLLKKPHFYPLRWLDQGLGEKYTAGLGMLALPFTTLRHCSWQVEEIWVVENEVNLYLLQPRKNALAIFAKGYALHNLKEIAFFSGARIYYWGDLDEDGYWMLHQFRQHYPHTVSILMDEDTVAFHRHQIIKINYRFKQPAEGLTPTELAGCRILLDQSGRIEQETLQQDFIQRYIASLDAIKKA